MATKFVLIFFSNQSLHGKGGREIKLTGQVFPPKQRTNLANTFFISFCSSDIGTVKK